MDLIRLLLLNNEKDGSVDLSRYSKEEIGYHKYLLINSGLVGGTYVASPDRQTRLSSMQIQCITQAGQDFLSYARDENVWHRAKDMISEKAVGPVSFIVLQAILQKVFLEMELCK